MVKKKHLFNINELNEYLRSSVESWTHSVRKWNNKAAFVAAADTRMLYFIQSALRLSSAQIDPDTDHKGSFKSNQPMAHQYAAAAASIS